MQSDHTVEESTGNGRILSFTWGTDIHGLSGRSKMEQILGDKV